MKGMWIRYVLFVAISFAIVLGYQYVAAVYFPEQPKPVADEGPPNQPGGEAEKPGSPEKPAAAPPAEQPTAEAPPVADEPEPAEAPEPEMARPAAAETLVTLGSASPADPYRMAVTITNRGAAVLRIELNDLRYRDIERSDGYLGQLFQRPMSDRNGCVVEVVAPGTPAAKAGILPGDQILSLAGQGVRSPATLDRALRKTSPNQTVEVEIERNKKKLTKQVTLGQRPLELIRPEADDPLSFLLTLDQVGEGKSLTEMRQEAEEKHKTDPPPPPADGTIGRTPGLGMELAGVDLREGNWHVLSPEADPAKPDTWKPAPAVPATAPVIREEVRFGRWLRKLNLAVVKTYRLAKVPENSLADRTAKAYHLDLEVALYNLGAKPAKVAYQLDGPTGLPTEGAWYAVKTSNNWSGVGIRDLAVQLGNRSPVHVSCWYIVDNNWGVPYKDRTDSIRSLGIDAQYFSAILIPQRPAPRDPASPEPESIWFADARPLLVGIAHHENRRIANTSCRMTTEPLVIDKSLVHRYQVFAGPKKPEVLAHYDLGGLVQYGWFWFVAEAMTTVLHFFHDWVFGNYGLAIIMLTVVVRLAMFPLSYRQALNSQMMQALQPEMKKIQEKYKNVEQRNKALMEFQRKHGFQKMMAMGCLTMLLQLPIFVGLYKALSADVELRGAPLFSQSIHWCSNLAAPDMLYYWGHFFPEWFNSGQGTGFFAIFYLGPYFNLLPIFTIILFYFQQKMLTPPPADEQAAMQQKIMQFSMLFMGVLFYKVASGLCIYFIASSLWGLAERVLLPKPKKAEGDGKSDKKTSGGEKKPTLFAGLTGGDGEAKPSGKKVRKGR